MAHDLVKNWLAKQDITKDVLNAIHWFELKNFIQSMFTK